MVMFFHSLMLSLTSLIFATAGSPLTSTICIIISALMVCSTLSLVGQSSWFSYILFLVFLGGLMVLFTYMCSVAPNESEELKISKKAKWAIVYTLMMAVAVSESSFDNLLNSSASLHAIFGELNYPLVLVAMVYLLITLLVCVQISSFKSGPVRMKKL